MNMAGSTAARYVVDAARSRFQVRAFSTGLLSAFGHNPTIAIRDFTGEARFNVEAPEQSSLRLDIDASSLTLTSDVNDKDRLEMESTMREEVLETARYPKITFESNAVQSNRIADGMYRMQIGGNLTLHGTTLALEVPCNVTAGDDTLRANGDFSIRQTDYGIRLVSVAGGGLKLKDDLKFTFDIVARRERKAAEPKPE